MKKSQTMLVWLSKIVLAQHFFFRMLRLAKGPAKPDTCCLLARLFDWFRWVAISSLLSFAVPVLVGEVGKK
jgi:hypothetical protein